MKVDPRWLDRQTLIREFFRGKKERERERLQNFEVLENIRPRF